MAALKKQAKPGAKARPRAGKGKAGSDRRPRDEHIHDRLYAAIINHRIAPGAPLLEDNLAKAFGVSRTIIRKVLQQLAHEQLVSIVPNKGASVAKPSAEEARQVFEARRTLEGMLIARVAAGASDSDIDGLLKIAHLEQQASERGSKTERVKLSGDFHRQLAAIAGNTVLSGFLNELVSRTSLIIALYESPGAVPCSHGEHLEIADALRRRDVARAAQYMDHHLLHIEAQLELTDVFQPVDLQALFAAGD